MSQKVKLKTDKVKDLMWTRYGLTVRAIKRVRGILQVTTESGRYSFKNAEELPDLPLIRDWLETIRRNGFGGVPELVPTLSGETNVSFEGDQYYLDRWIDADELPEGLLYDEPLGAALAKFHRASRGLIIPADHGRYRYGQRKSVLLDCHARLGKWREERAADYAFEEQMLDFLLYRCRLAFAYIQHISFPNNSVRAALCHGSLHHRNILIDRQHDIWFIDFESMAYAERVLDLAQLIHYYAYPHEWNPVVIERLVQSYRMNHPDPLSKEEYRYFLSYLAFPRRLYNAMNRYLDSKPAARTAYLKLKKLIELEWAKERFLRTYDPESVERKGF